MNTFTAEEQRVVLFALTVTLAVTSVQLFSRAPRAAAAVPAAAVPPGEGTAATAATTSAPDPNEASLEILMGVPNMKPALASAIIRYRKDRILASPDDLRNLPGVEAADVDRVAARLAFPGARAREAPAPGQKIDLNRASAEELERLPGVGPATARAIMERRRVRRFADVEELLDVPGIGPRKLEMLQPHVVAGQARRD